MPKALAPIDKSVIVPEAVRRAAAASDALMQAQTGAPESELPPEPVVTAPEPPPPQEPTPPAEPPPEPTAPPPPPPPPAPTPPPAQAQLDDNDDSWKRRYEAANGRVQAGARIISELNERVGQLEMLLATQQAPPPEPTETQRFVTDDDVNTYGEDFLAMVQRAAREMIEPIKTEYEAKLNGLGGAVQGVTKVIQQNSKDKMRDFLSREISDWRDINRSPAFRDDWVLQVDDLTGQVRKDMLLNAWERNDAPRVAAFFRTFLREQAIQNGVEPTEPTPPAPARAPAVQLGAFAAPGRAKQVAPSTAQPSKQPISRKFITSFYADVAAGRYLNNDKRKNEIERDIWDAQAEGRITA